MADSFVLEIPEQVGLAVATARKPQAKTRDWPAGTRIVSADSHMLEPDLWVDRFPEHLSHQAPRMVFRDGGWDINGEKVWINGGATSGARVCAPGRKGLPLPASA